MPVRTPPVHLVRTPCVPRRWTFPAELESVPRARHRAVGALVGVAGESYIEALADDLALVVGELVANAVRHGSLPDGEQLVEVTLWRADGYLWLAVSDAGDDDLPVRSTTPALNACRGRGLLIVDAVADVRVVLKRAGVGKSVVVGLILP